MIEIDWAWFNFDLAGWYSLPVAGLGVVYVKVSLVDGTWRVTEIYVDGGDRPIDFKVLRSFPFSALEQEASDTASRSDRLSIGFPKPGPDLRGLLAHLAPASASWIGEPAQLPPREPLTLTYDPAEGLTDRFLTEVAKVYGWAIRQRKPPATEMARQVGVSVRTAQSWISKARKRGLLPPATRKGRTV